MKIILEISEDNGKIIKKTFESFEEKNKYFLKHKELLNKCFSLYVEK